MKIGATFPQAEIGSDPAVIRDWAQAAEDLGYEHILIYDHVLGAVREGREPPLRGVFDISSTFHEPLVTFGYLAAVTSRIILATGVLVLPQRQAALVAKQAAEVDVLSGGRLRLGVGIGGNHVEYEALGAPLAGRGPRQEEQIALMRQLWTEPVVDFTGRYHRIDRAGILPRPGRDIPIWFGGASKPLLDRAARIGDGYIAIGLGPELKEIFGWLTTRLIELGRDPAAFGLECQVQYSRGPALWAKDVEDVGAAGGNFTAINTMWSGLAGPRDHIDALRRFKDAVGF